VAFSTTAAGNTLACRLLHVTNAALYSSQNNAAMLNNHCPHTQATPTGPCATAVP
jgi:hypothetical protein